MKGAVKVLGRFLRRGVADLELLLEGKLLFFLITDFLLVAWGVVQALFLGGKLAQIYRTGVILPTLILLVTALSALIALEKRAGSLDLALASPDPTFFFLRRALAPLALLIAQGWLVLLLAFAERHPGFRAGRLEGWEELARALFSSGLVALLVGAVTLFWTTRLRAGGAVLAATAATLLFFVPFLLTSPQLTAPKVFPKNVFEANAHLAAWLWPMVVMTAAALLFFGAALERLRRPELLS